MTYCSNCGAPVEGKFCPKCGTAVSASAGSGSSTAYTPDPPSYASPVTAAGLSNNVAAALCYVAGLITGILFLVLAPYNQNKFVRFHAFQSIFFHGVFIAIWIVESVLSSALPYGVWTLMALVRAVISLAFLAGWIALLVKAYQGERWKLPVIGDLAEKQA